ncbi:unnamed protein product [Urochloa humidicola]
MRVSYRSPHSPPLQEAILFSSSDETRRAVDSTASASICSTRRPAPQLLPSGTAVAPRPLIYHVPCFTGVGGSCSPGSLNPHSTEPDGERRRPRWAFWSFVGSNRATAATGQASVRGETHRQFLAAAAHTSEQELGCTIAR